MDQIFSLDTHTCLIIFLFVKWYVGRGIGRRGKRTRYTNVRVLGERYIEL